MKKLKFNSDINASAEKVYSTMIDENYFKEWISAFGSNFYFEGSWNKGEKIVYLSPDENGVLQGVITY